jgi:hypothetical protein
MAIGAAKSVSFEEKNVRFKISLQKVLKLKKITASAPRWANRGLFAWRSTTGGG